MHWHAPTFLTYHPAWTKIFYSWYAARHPPLSSSAVSVLTIASYPEFSVPLAPAANQGGEAIRCAQSRHEDSLPAGQRRARSTYARGSAATGGGSQPPRHCSQRRQASYRSRIHARTCLEARRTRSGNQNSAVPHDSGTHHYHNRDVEFAPAIEATATRAITIHPTKHARHDSAFPSTRIFLRR